MHNKRIHTIWSLAPIGPTERSRRGAQLKIVSDFPETTLEISSISSQFEIFRDR